MTESVLLQKAASLYGVSPADLKILRGGTYNKVFEYEVNSRSFILRIARKEAVLTGLGTMLGYLAYLSQNGLPVPIPNPSGRGVLMEEVSEDCTYTVHCFSKIEGTPAEDLNGDNLSPDIFRQMGLVVGKMHLLSQSYRSLNPALCIPQWNETDNLFNPGVKQTTASPVIREKYALAVRSVMSLPGDRDVFGIIHTDTHLANIIVSADRHVGLIDFDDICLGWYIMDIAVTLFDLLVVAGKTDDVLFAESFLIDYICGYTSTRNLSSFWIAQIPLFLKLLEISLYIKLRSDWQPGDTTSWLGKFFLNREHRILNEVPYIDLDWKKIGGDL